MSMSKCSIPKHGLNIALGRNYDPTEVGKDREVDSGTKRACGLSPKPNVPDVGPSLHIIHLKIEPLIRPDSDSFSEQLMRTTTGIVNHYTSTFN